MSEKIAVGFLPLSKSGQSIPNAGNPKWNRTLLLNPLFRIFAKEAGIESVDNFTE